MHLNTKILEFSAAESLKYSWSGLRALEFPALVFKGGVIIGSVCALQAFGCFVASSLAQAGQRVAKCVSFPKEYSTSSNDKHYNVTHKRKIMAFIIECFAK